jgi:hypothetical protein
VGRAVQAPLRSVRAGSVSQRSSTGMGGHQRSPTVRRNRRSRALGSSSWDNADGRFRLWSRRSGFESSRTLLRSRSPMAHLHPAVGSSASSACSFERSSYDESWPAAPTATYGRPDQSPSVGLTPVGEACASNSRRRPAKGSRAANLVRAGFRNRSGPAPVRRRPHV